MGSRAILSPAVGSRAILITVATNDLPLDDHYFVLHAEDDDLLTGSSMLSPSNIKKTKVNMSFGTLSS